jgi:hypothetical protein
MQTQQSTAPAIGDIPAMVVSFARRLRARNRSPRTIQSYEETVC